MGDIFSSSPMRENMSKLPNKIAVVIGCQDGIGGAIAERFAAEGRTVYATSRGAVEARRRMAPFYCVRVVSMPPTRGRCVPLARRSGAKRAVWMFWP
jgi:NAD(P)-dependent dehydrogenase (short-subunit alcohol dehydrogenase family)